MEELDAYLEKVYREFYMSFLYTFALILILIPLAFGFMLLRSLLLDVAVDYGYLSAR